ncbi:MAG: hypothetical protein JO069_00405, partial [Verrucomicrobia bacterium]|nr:hypothetical protein [Verrucomicrobiota bacterium]
MSNDLDETGSMSERSEPGIQAVGIEGYRPDESDQGQSRPGGEGSGLVRLAPSLLLPILPVRGLVVFPGLVVPITIGRPSALKLVDTELPDHKQLGLVAQRVENQDRPGP